METNTRTAPSQHRMLGVDSILVAPITDHLEGLNRWEHESGVSHL